MFGGKQLRGAYTAHYAPKRRAPIKPGTWTIGWILGILAAAVGLFAGSSWTPGDNKAQPGVYVRTTSAEQPPATFPSGVAAAIFRSSWGPLGSVQTVGSEGAVEVAYGNGGTTIIPKLATRGARQVKTVRLGAGGTASTKLLQAAAVTKATLTAKYAGTRGSNFKVTLRANLLDATKDDLILIDGTTVIETITFVVGADEAAALVAAVNLDSDYVTAVLNAAGAIDDYTASAFTAGVDPVITSADYVTALGLLATEAFDVLVTDTEDATIHTTIGTQISTWRAAGKRVMAVVGEPISVAWATRKANATAQNRKGVVYVGNGFKAPQGINATITDFDGADAAARVAGIIASLDLTQSLTNEVIPEATDLVGPLTTEQIDEALLAGVLVFNKNAAGNVRVVQGINTLVTPAADEDAGWKKIRRVRTRDALISQSVEATDPLVGKVSNDRTGRALLQSKIQGVINRLIAEGALADGTVTEDPTYKAATDAAYFLITVDDLDSAEKVYLTFAFRLAPPVAA